MPFRRCAPRWAVAGVVWAVAAGWARAEPPDRPPRAEGPLPKLDVPVPKLDVPLPTLGGKQFWTDCVFFHQWRIQRSALTGQFRLLDPNNLQHAAGGYVTCRAELEQIKRSRNLPPMKGKAVIVLHGLVRSRWTMSKLCDHLEKQGGYTVLNMSYASTRHEVARHAEALDSIVRRLEGIDQINLVGHSLGNLVIRHWLYDRGHRRDGRRPEVRLGRVVMLAPPNHGSILAVALADTGVYGAITGKSGEELSRQWANLEGKLATPPCPFGIIAGGRSDDIGFNPFLEGDDDGTVSVASTRLAGAADFVLVPTIHPLIPSDSRTLEYTLRFLQKGHFISPDKRQQIPKD